MNCRDPFLSRERRVRTGREIAWGLSRFSRSENGTVPLRKTLTKRCLVVCIAVWTFLGSSPHGPAAEPTQPPWEGQYKIRPDEKERLTEADVVGPDGLVYPDWTYAGVPGGIPDVAVKARLADFGGRPDDDRDDSQALDRAVEHVAASGGGAVLLASGTYHLDRPVIVRHDGIVIRGLGAGKTRLIFRYAIPAAGATFYRPRPDEVVYADSWLQLHAVPRDLSALEVRIDGKRASRRERSKHWGNTFSLTVGGGTLLRRVGEGKHQLTGIAEYKDGAKKETSEEIRLSRQTSPQPEPRPIYPGALSFAGRGPVGPRVALAADAVRGSRQIKLRSTEGLQPGDRIVIEAPASPRWNRLVKNACKWGTYRRYRLRIDKITGDTIRVNQPLRLTFPVVDGSYVEKIEVIRRCGVEDLYLEQIENLWIGGIAFSNAWECWAKGLTVKMTGRHACYAAEAKWCEIRDSVFDDAHFKGGGGTAYVGWEKACDCLMENVATYKMRHAPCVQWAASGNVIRKSTFHESDGQWHSGWTNENLFELCTIDSKRGHGGYGYGMWASPPEDTAHGPNGPRNVVYNCDVRSPRAGLWMGGMNESWLILYNRFVVAGGPGIFAKTASFDHVIRGNVIALADQDQPAVRLATPDCIGVELIQNRVYGGSGTLVSGSGKPAVEEDNHLLPATENPPAPEPPVPSIFEWQRQHLTSRR